MLNIDYTSATTVTLAFYAATNKPEVTAPASVSGTSLSAVQCSLLKHLPD